MASVHGAAAVDDFFYSRLVLSENSPVRCSSADGQDGWCSLSDISRFKFLMEKIGLMRRILIPQAVLRQHERSIQLRARSRTP